MAKKSIAFSMLLPFVFGGAALLLTATWTYASSARPAVDPPFQLSPIQNETSPDKSPSDSFAGNTALPALSNQHPQLKATDATITDPEARLADISSQALPSTKDLTSQQKNVERAKLEVDKRLQWTLDPKSAPAAIDGESSEDRDSRLAGELRRSVEKLFELRMQLQNARLDDAEAKLAASRQRLVRRQSLATQIVDRRVKELLSTDETQWNLRPSGISKRESRQSAPDLAAALAPSRSQALPRSIGKEQLLPNPTRFSTQLPLVDPMHQVGPGDVLGIFVPGVFDAIDLNLSKTGSGYPIHVKSDGMISLPPLGRLKVAGKTVLEIENEVKKKYVEGVDPILQDEARDKISVVVQQIYEPAARANSGRGLRSLVDPMHRVKAGDVLGIFVPHVFDDMDRGPTSPGYPIHVKSDGKISLPLIGRLKATGKTAIEIEDQLKKKYTDGTDPIFTEEYRDSISVVVHQVYMPASPANSGLKILPDEPGRDNRLLQAAQAQAIAGKPAHRQRIMDDLVKKVDKKKAMLSELTSDLVRSEAALENGREACIEHVWLLEAEGKIKPGSLTTFDNSRRIAQETRTLEELELQRDQLIAVQNLDAGDAQVKALNLKILGRKKKIEMLKTYVGVQPEQIIQRYIVGIKQQIGDIRQTLKSDFMIYREIFEKAVKSERADAGRSNKLVDSLDAADAAQLAAQTFLDLYFSGDIKKANELTNNPRPIKTLREFINPGTTAAPKVIGFSGSSSEAYVSTDGVVRLKKALPRTGHKQATLGLRMQKNDSDGWRVLEVFLGGLKTGDRKAPKPSTPTP